MATHNEYGIAAEQLAAELVQRRGWTIVRRNWRFGRKEVDLIVRRGSTVAFVEVRARQATEFGHPLHTIGPRKRRDLETAARGWIERHGGAGELYRFDVVTVVGPCGPSRGPPDVHYLEDAWRPGQ